MTNTRNLAKLAAALDDGTSGQVLTSTGSGGVTFSAASGGGGSMTVYNDLNGTDGTPSGYTYLTNSSSPSNGDLAFVTANNTVYVRAASGWRKIATIQESPGTITGHSASYPSIGQSATTDITLSSTDPEGFDVTWSYTVGGNGTLSGSNINNSNGDTLASIAVQTANANSGGTNTITYRITRETTSVAGDFTITFTATDTQATGTSDTGAISFELAFIVDDSHYTTLLMSTDGSAGDNNDITDSSSSNHTISVNGDAHAGSFSPYRHGGYSTYMLNTDDLTVASDADFNFGSGDFTIEYWIWPNGTPNNPVGLPDMRPASTNGPYVQININTSNQVGLYVDNAQRISQSSSTALTSNAWNHVCLARSGSTTTLYIGGASVGSWSDSTTYSQGRCLIAGHSIETNRGWASGCYVTDFRIVKGTAVYTSNFTPPTERLTAITNTSLLTCHLPYISDGSSNGHSITINGGVEAKPFGPYDYNQYSKSVNGGSIHFDGTGDYLTVYDTGLSVGNNSAFTVEFWFLTSKNPDALQNIWNTYPSSTASMTDEQLKFAYSNISGLIALYDRQNSTNILEVTNKRLGRNTWNHFCWTRDASNNHKFYINGEQIGTSTSSTSYDTNRMVFGVREYNLTSYLEGNISDFRLVKGTVVYSGEFTPPTGPLTTTGGTYSDTTNVNTSITAGHTKLLLSGTDAHVIDKSQNSNLKLVNDAAAVTNAPNNSNISSTNAVSFDGNGDRIYLDENNSLYDLSYGEGDFSIEGWFYFNSYSNNPKLYIDIADSSTYWQLYYVNGTGLTFRANNTGINVNAGSALSLNTWYFISLVREGSTYKVYVDGTSVISTTTTHQIGSNSYKDIGGTATGAAASLNGYIQDFRLTKGLARHVNTNGTYTYPVPSAPLKA